MNSPLTPREGEIFQLIVEEGLTNPEIAKRLGISERVTKFHSANLLGRRARHTGCALSWTTGRALAR